VVFHEDGQACSVHQSTLCEVIAHADTTVEDIEDRVFGHAQFECAYELIETQQYEKLRAYAWCLVGHCPSSSACTFPQWNEAQCESEVHNWLGFAYRSETGYGATANRATKRKYEEKGYAHYHLSLELNNANYGTWGYMGQLFVLQGDRDLADLCLSTLCRAVGPSHHSTEVVLADFAAAGWKAGECVVDPAFDPAASFALLPAPTTDASEDFDAAEAAADREVIKYKVVETTAAETGDAPRTSAGFQLDSSLFVGIALGFGVAAATGLIAKLAGRPPK
jgi:hypothetical protein